MRSSMPRRFKKKSRRINKSPFRTEIFHKPPFYYGAIISPRGSIIEITHHFLCEKIAILQLNRRIRIFNSALPEKEKLEELHVQD